MDYSKLDELVKIKKKGDKSKEVKNEYSNELLNLLKEEGFSDTAVKYIYDGFSFSGAFPFFEYLKTETPQNIDQIYFQLKNNRYFFTNKDVTLKLILHLFSFMLNEKPEQTVILADMISVTPKLTKNRDGSIRNDLEKVLEKYLLTVLDNRAKLPEISALNVKKASLIEFRKMLYSGLENYIPSKQLITNNMAKLQKWLEMSEETGRVEQRKETIAAPPADAGEKKELLPVTDSEKEKQIAKVDSLPEWKKGLLAVEKCITEFENKINSQNQTLLEMNIETGKLKKQLSLKESDLTTINAEIGELKKSNSQYWVDIRELKKKLEISESDLLLSRQELLSRIELSEILDRDKKKQQEAFLHRLSNELRLEYLDYVHAKDEAMTIDLGENMRLQLSNIFEILKNAGLVFME